MPAKIKAVPFGGDKKDRGKFNIRGFNLFVKEDVTEYEDLRTKATDNASGIVIDNVREFTRKVTTREGQGEDQIVTTTEELFIFVQWWKKAMKPPEPGDDDEKPNPKSEDGKPDWSAERKAADPVEAN